MTMKVKRLRYFNGAKHDGIATGRGGITDIHLVDGMAMIEYKNGNNVYIYSSYLRLLVKGRDEFPEGTTDFNDEKFWGE
ncbi:hypothetical protein WDR10_11240 [Kurthia gibsonii]|uniref:hypothetical protein n=1 Tax=Kurthia gibsonii TaxID=33946 RepID=UPI0030D50C96